MPHKIDAQGVKDIAAYIASNTLHLASSSTGTGHKRLKCIGGGARFVVTHYNCWIDGKGFRVDQEFATLEEAVAAYNAIDKEGAK